MYHPVFQATLKSGVEHAFNVEVARITFLIESDSPGT